MSNVVKLHDKSFKIMISADEIDKAVEKVADKINADYSDKKNPIFMGVLNGAFMYMSDLIKKITINCEVSFVKVASYEGDGSTGVVRNLIGVSGDLEGRDIIVVEDIVDTGCSIEHLFELLEPYKPASIRVCTLFYKPAAYTKQIPIDYCAMEIGNEFIVGYGLDYDQLGRNLKDIYVVE